MISPIVWVDDAGELRGDVRALIAFWSLVDADVDDVAAALALADVIARLLEHPSCR